MSRVIDAYAMWAAHLSWSDVLMPAAAVGKGIREAARLGRDMFDSLDSSLEEDGYNTMIDGVEQPSSLRIGAAAVLVSVDHMVYQTLRETCDLFLIGEGAQQGTLKGVTEDAWRAFGILTYALGGAAAKPTAAAAKPAAAAADVAASAAQAAANVAPAAKPAARPLRESVMRWAAIMGERVKVGKPVYLDYVHHPPGRSFGPVPTVGRDGANMIGESAMRIHGGQFGGFFDGEGKVVFIDQMARDLIKAGYRGGRLLLESCFAGGRTYHPTLHGQYDSLFNPHPPVKQLADQLKQALRGIGLPDAPVVIRYTGTELVSREPYSLIGAPHDLRGIRWTPSAPQLGGPSAWMTVVGE